MKFSFNSIFLLLNLFYSPILLSAGLDKNYESTWHGIEVVGTDSVTAEKIRALQPITIGEKFRVSERKYYSEKCQQLIKKNMSLKKVDCSPLWYGDRVAYLIVEINEKGFDKKTFRAIPKNNKAIKKVPKELKLILTKLEAQIHALMSSGNFPREIHENGFKDFHDPILHKLAIQLAQLVPKYNQAILDVVHYSPDVTERQKAAHLFAWSNHAENFHYLLEWNLLTDPNSGVRNNIARSFSQFIKKSHDEALLKDLIPVYCKQAELPNHMDRNKAVLSILRILENNPTLVTAVSLECKENITYISNSSILVNVRDPAKDILKILEAAEHA